MDTVFNNKLYFPMMLVVFALTGLLNISPKLVVCAGIYTLLISTTNLMSEVYGKKNAFMTLGLCVLANIILTFKSLDMMLISSFFPVLVSAYVGLTLSWNFKSKFSFPVRNFIALTACSVIDSILMTSTLITKFSIDKSLSISFGDLLLKLFYSLAASMLILGITYLIKQNLRSE